MCDVGFTSRTPFRLSVPWPRIRTEENGHFHIRKVKHAYTGNPWEQNLSEFPYKQI